MKIEDLITDEDLVASIKNAEQMALERFAKGPGQYETGSQEWKRRFPKFAEAIEYAPTEDTRAGMRAMLYLVDGALKLAEQRVVKA